MSTELGRDESLNRKPLTQAARLAGPVPKKYISQVNAGGNRMADYVSHSVINEILLMVCGPFDFEVTQPIRSAEGKVEGCLARLTIDVDGRRTSVVEVGDTTGQEKTDGERMKNAASDALKRAAMRVGVGLHLWSGLDNYFLFAQLTKLEGGDAVQGASPQPAASPSLDVDDDGLCIECGRDPVEHASTCSRRKF